MEVTVTSRRPNVATSQRHDVESTMQKSTSKNVVTSQRRDVSMSRRYNVATSARDLHPINLSTNGSEKEESGGGRTKARNSRAE